MGGLFGGKNTTIDNGSVASFAVNQATYGIVVPIILGTSRQQANVIDYFDFTTISNKSTQKTGKGGGSSTTTVTYTYKAAVVLALAGNVALGIDQVWVDTDTITTLANTGLTLFSGEIGQAVWDYTVTKEPTHAIPYSGLAYVAGYIDLNDSGGLKNYNFEIRGELITSPNGYDINPADGVVYVLTNISNGLDFSLDNFHTNSLANFKLYCQASYIFLTVPMTDQEKSYEIINRLCEITNTIVFWSQSKIKFVPRCESELTANGVTYTPNTIPEYDLTSDDFIENDDGKLVTWERTDNAETYNHVTIEFTNRSNSYETETAEYEILADINKRGRRSMSTITYDWIHDKTTAEVVAQQIAMDSCYSRNTYSFTLGLGFSRLEPGDIVTLTETSLNIPKMPVMIESFTENGEEYYDVVAKYRPFGTYSPARYATYESDRALIDRNVAPGDISYPVVFDAPTEITTTGLETWIAASSSNNNWGGCNIWISDDNEVYKQIGTINGPTRMGLLTELMTDSDSVLSVQLDGDSQLSSGTLQDVQNLNTLCWVNGELIAYQDATLTGESTYNLSGIVRGAKNTTVLSHAICSKFVRLDDDIFKYAFSQSDIGKTIYIKLTSFNTFGYAEVDLADTTAIQHVINPQASPGVSGVKLTENTYRQKDGTIITSVDVAFTPPIYSTFGQFDIYYDIDSDNDWTYAGSTQISKYSITSIPTLKTIRVKITTTDKYKNVSDFVISDSIYITGKDKPPSNVTGLAVVQDSQDATKLIIEVNQITDVDFKALQITINDVVLPLVYGFKYLHTINTSGIYYISVVALDWSDNQSAIPATTSINAQVEPADIVNFQALQNGEYVLLSWTKPSEPNATVEVRQGATFSNGSLIKTGYTENTLQFLADTETTRRYWIKTINKSGYYSINSVSAEVAIANLQPKNVVVEYDEIVLQSGTHNNTVFGQSYYTCLTLPGKCSDYVNVKCSEIGGNTVLKLTTGATYGEYLIARKDIGSIITANISSQFITSVLLGIGMTAKLQFRTSTNGTYWDEWKDFMPIISTFRYIDMRAILSKTGAISPEVNVFSEVIDVDDVSKMGISTVAIGGTAISYGNAYRNTPVVTPTAVGVGLRAELVSIGLTSFVVKILNLSNIDVGGQVSWRSNGF